MKSTMQLFLDQFSIGISFLCAMHCTLIPIIMILFPIVGAYAIDDHTLHATLAIVILPIALIALSLGYFKHQRKKVVLIGSLGLMAILFGTLVAHEIFGENAERIFTLLGSVMLVIAHYKNYDLCQRKCVD